VSYSVTYLQVIPSFDVKVKVNYMVYPKIKAGSEIFIRIEIRDNTDVETPLVDPTSAKITIRNTMGVAIVDEVTTTNADVGVYTYYLQTTTSDVKGVHTSVFKVEDVDGTVVYTLPEDVYELVS
jgi:hypothetical protein